MANGIALFRSKRGTKSLNRSNFAPNSATPLAASPRF
jgi:hypothetical protein